MRISKFSIIISGLLLLSPMTAYAYLDAGTGSQVLQIVIASLVGGAFAFKMGFKKIRYFLSSKFSKKKDNE